MSNNNNCTEDIFTEAFSDSRIDFLSDGILRTEDGATFKIHRVLLAQRSEYFCALFMGLGNSKSDALIPGIGQSTLGHILRYIYTGHIQLEGGNLRDVLVAADYLLLDCILQEGRRIAEEGMNASNCLPLFLAACEIERLGLREKTHRFVLTHFEYVVRQWGELIGDLSLSSLKEFLGNESLRVSGEKTVWLAIVLWVKRNVVERLIFVPDLVLCLALEDIDENLATKIVEHDYMQNNQHCQSHNIRKRANETNLDYLKHFIENHTKSKLFRKSTRLPSNMFLVSCSSKTGNGTYLYLSKDEKIDFWYEIAKLPSSPEIIIKIGLVIYILDFHNEWWTFDLISKEKDDMDDSYVERESYCVVKLENYIYALGGYSQLTGEVSSCVEFYDRNADTWVRVSDMIAMDFLRAVGIGGRIYAVGAVMQDSEVMMTQVYDPISDVWTILRPPNVFRRNFALVAFHELLYIIGGENDEGHLKTVEIYDAAEDTWRSHADMPVSYLQPRAVIVKDLLFVYDNDLTGRKYGGSHPPIYWNLDAEVWMILPPCSPWYKIHHFPILLFDDLEEIRTLVNKCKTECIGPTRSLFP